MKLHYGFLALGIIALIFFVFSTSIILNTRPSSLERLSLKEGGISENARIITAFIQGADELPELSAREKAHLVDVKSLYKSFLILHIGSLAAIICTLILLLFLDYPLLNAGKHYLFYTGIIGLGLTLLFLLFFIPFSTSFTLIHQPFFSAGTFAFPASSTLIQTFPQSFFRSLFTRILISCFIVYAGFLGLGYWLRRK